MEKDHWPELDLVVAGTIGHIVFPELSLSKKHDGIE